MKPYYERDGVALYHGDCREILPTVPPADLVWTSPPYGQQRDYGQKITDWDALMIPAFRAIQAKPDTQVLVNLGLIHRDGEVITYWDRWIEDMRSQGWRRFGWYVWDQGSGLPGDWNGRLAPSHEFVFHLNREARHPNKTEPCRSFGRRITGTGMRSSDGATSERMCHDGAPVNQFKIPDSVIRVTREMHREWDHPAMFPVALAAHIIKSFTVEGQTVVEPFAGSGTTLVAALQCGRCAYGCELEEKYCEIIAERLRKHEAPLFAPLVDEAREQLGLM